jgi:hypothetical protein
MPSGIDEPIATACNQNRQVIVVVPITIADGGSMNDDGGIEK